MTAAIAGYVTVTLMTFHKQGRAQDFFTGGKTECRDRRWGSWGGCSNPSLRQLEGLGSAVSSPSGVRGGALTDRPKVSTIFSTQGVFSGHNIILLIVDYHAATGGQDSRAPPPFAYAPVHKQSNGRRIKVESYSCNRRVTSMTRHVRMGAGPSVGALVVGDGCLDDASKQNVERLDVMVVDGAAVGAAHLPAAVAVVGRTRVGSAHSACGSAHVTGRPAAAAAAQPGAAAQQCREHVVEVDVADDEQRPVPRRSATPALQPLAFTLHMNIRHPSIYFIIIYYASPIMSPPLIGDGIKRCFCLTSVCRVHRA